MMKIGRRKFFKGILYSLASLEFGYVFFRLLGHRKDALAETSYYEAGEVSVFEKGGVYPFGAAEFFLCRLDDGGFIAVSSKCTHLGCVIQFNTNHDRFECPCHASAFDKDGSVISSPAARALDYYPIAFKGNKVLVDTANPVKRSKFDRSQVMYA